MRIFEYIKANGRNQMGIKLSSSAFITVREASAMPSSGGRGERREK
jgi:hypothetical protein